jgi:alpha-mannosidase
LTNPQFAYEASNAVIEPIRDQLPGTNTDAYAAQHWVSVHDHSGGIAWSSLEAPIVELGGLWPGYVSQAHHGVTPPGYGHAFLRSPEELRHGHIYSHVMNNNFRTNFQPVHVTDALFRYVITTHDGGQARDRARALGWEAAVGPVTAYVVGPQDAPHSGLLPASDTFCRMDAAGVVLLTLKAAEDGDGLILRLAETEGQDRQTTIHLPYFDIREAWQTNLVEEDEEQLPSTLHTVVAPLSAHGLTTVRCRGSRRFPATTVLAAY